MLFYFDRGRSVSELDDLLGRETCNLVFDAHNGKVLKVGAADDFVRTINAG